MSFGKTIKNLRRKHDMTQERLADALSISPQAVSRWETDMAMPDISLIAPLCNLFHVTADECAVLRDKRIALLNLFFENGDFGYSHIDLSDIYKDQAVYYLKKGDCPKALKHLQLAAEHAIKFITFDKEEHTSLVFRGHGHGSWSSGSSDNTASHLLKDMERSVFDGIRDKEDFIKIKEQLSEYAGKWCVE